MRGSTLRECMRRHPVVALAVPVTAVALALAGCSSTSAGTKAGSDSAPLTLRLGTDDPQGRPGSDQIEEFARQVAELSAGEIRIEPVFTALGSNNLDDWDQKVAGLVTSAELDMGMIPARAWDTEGVDTMRSLHAPFLVTSDELLNQVVSDDTLAAELLGGLESIGVTGLALLPEGLRHVFAFGDLLLEPADFVGVTVRTPTSATTYALFEALGAAPDDLAVEDVLAGSAVAAADTSFALAHTLPAATTAVGNLTLFPKINSLVINTGVFSELDEGQQDVLREAALATRAWAIETNPTDAEQAATYCENGGSILLATDDEVDAIRLAVQPVYDELEKDDATAGMIARIGELAAQVQSSARIQACAPATQDRPLTRADIVAHGGELPNGTYRVEYTDDYLRAHGMDEEGIQNNHGVWTLSLEDGRWTVDQIAQNLTDHFADIYQVDGDNLYWRFHHSHEGFLHLTWSVDSHGNLHFKEVGATGVPDFQFDLPWTRIE